VWSVGLDRCCLRERDIQQFTTVRPEDGQARPKHVVTFDNKIQNHDSCVFRQTPPPSFENIANSLLNSLPFMAPDDSLACSKYPTNGAIHEPHKPSLL
jgi:hypothetical protein